MFPQQSLGVSILVTTPDYINAISLRKLQEFYRNKGDYVNRQIYQILKIVYRMVIVLRASFGIKYFTNSRFYN